MFGQSSAVSPLVGTEVDVGADALVVDTEADLDAPFCVDMEGDEADMVKVEGYEAIVRDAEEPDTENDAIVVEAAESATISYTLEVDAVLGVILDDVEDKDPAVTLESLEELKAINLPTLPSDPESHTSDFSVCQRENPLHPQQRLQSQPQHL